MGLPYTVPSRTWDLGTVADGRFFQTEFEQLYDNDVYLDDLGARIAALTAKTTIAAADKLILSDSAASNAAKYITGTNLLAAVAVVEATWRAHTLAGYGSTDTKIPYFTTVVENVDTAGAFTVANNSTNGLSITINIAGRYAVKASINGNSAFGVGISLNSAQLTTAINSITAADRLASTITGGASYGGDVSITKWFAVDDVIRPHTEGNAAGTAATCLFCIERMT